MTVREAIEKLQQVSNWNYAVLDNYSNEIDKIYESDAVVYLEPKNENEDEKKEMTNEEAYNYIRQSICWESDRGIGMVQPPQSQEKLFRAIQKSCNALVENERLETENEFVKSLLANLAREKSGTKQALWKEDDELGVAFFCSNCRTFIYDSGECSVCGENIDLNLPKIKYDGRVRWK